MCYTDEKWTEALPLVHLGLRTAYKEHLKSSAAELVYGEPPRVSGELLVPAPRRSRHLASYSSSAAIWTTCDQLR